jgi:hypothetical protein
MSPDVKLSMKARKQCLRPKKLQDIFEKFLVPRCRAGVSACSIFGSSHPSC